MTKKDKTAHNSRIKLIAGFSQFTKVRVNFLSVFYLLNSLLKTRN
jgi:hypothetical protein